MLYSNDQINKVKSIVYIISDMKYMDLKFGCLENKNGEHRINSSLEKLKQLFTEKLKISRQYFCINFRNLENTFFFAFIFVL